MRKVVLSLLVGCFVNFLAFSQTDSLGIKKEGDKYFVMHKVIAGQTLYSLSRRYGTSVTDIKNKNAELANGLQVGQTILIPYSKPVNAVNPTSASSHVVKTGETLFSISRQYNVNVEDIKKLNGLTSNELSIGQTLKIAVAPAATDKKEVTPVVNKTEDAVKKEVIAPAEEKVKESAPKTVAKVDTAKNANEIAKKEDPEDAYNAKPFEEVIEEGQAELIIEDESSTKFLALHKTAEVGTVIKVKNRMNNLTVYVRVVGEIPNTTDNENIIIKINKRAYDQLKALDTRFLVELSYFK
uniref:LysM peptidoglycan-binding domain-containing protein n=1 Tax=Roseivirga sp. TaxID=1964215 RepID=UPI004048A870